jgi:AcrR family transcriptional regulator
LESRRNEIANAAYQLFSKKGFKDTSVEEVANFLGIDKRTLYNYIEKKEDLLYLVFRHYLPIVSQAVTEKISQVDDLKEKLRIAIITDLECTSKLQNFVMLVSRELRYLDKDSIQSTLNLIKNNFRIFENIVREGVHRGVFKPCNPSIVTYLIKAQIHMLATYRWGLKNFGLDEITNHIIETLFCGIAKSG